MKYIRILITVILLSSISAYGQTTEQPWKKNYIDIGFVYTELEQQGLRKLKSDYGASFRIGRTFFLHKKPISGKLKFGIDATWCDVTYTDYDVKYISNYIDEHFHINECEIGMQVGPSLTFRPYSDLYTDIYWRYAPSYSCFFGHEGFQGRFVSFFVTGVSVTYKCIGLGLEQRYGRGQFRPVVGYDASGGITGRLSSAASTLKAFVSFKF